MLVSHDIAGGVVCEVFLSFSFFCISRVYREKKPKNKQKHSECAAATSDWCRLTVRFLILNLKKHIIKIFHKIYVLYSLAYSTFFSSSSPPARESKFSVGEKIVCFFSAV